MELSSFRDSLRGLGWFVAACQVGSQIISVAVLVILYSRLGPQPFGVLAMALPAVTLGRLVAGFGISIAGVASTSLDDTTQSALFWFGLGWAVLAAIAVGLSGLLLAPFFEEPALLRVVPALAITLIFAAVGTLHQVRLERALRVSTVAAMRIVALAAGGIAAVAAAELIGGVWALVVQQLFEWGTLAVAFWIAEPWVPRIVRPSAASLRTFRQGGAFAASSLAFWVAQNIDTIIVGRWGGALQLGLYNQAYNLVMKPVLLVTTPLTAVMLPTLARTVDSPAEYQRLLRGFFRTVGILLFPCGMGLLVFPVNVMELLGGEHWAEGEGILRTLAPLMLMQGFINICGSVFASLGRFDRLLKGALAYAAAISLATVVAAWWGPAESFRLRNPFAVNIALGVTLATAIFLFPYLRYCFTTVPVAGSTMLRAARSSAVAAILMALGVLVAPDWIVAALDARPNRWWLASTAIVIGVALYAALAAGEIRWLIRRDGDKR